MHSVYPEVRDVLSRWKNEKIPVYIALGSEKFIKLVLPNTTSGDILNVSFFSFRSPIFIDCNNFIQLKYILDLLNRPLQLFTGRLPVITGGKEGGSHLVLNFKKVAETLRVPLSSILYISRLPTGKFNITNKVKSTATTHTHIHAQGESSMLCSKNESLRVQKKKV